MAIDLGHAYPLILDRLDLSSINGEVESGPMPLLGDEELRRRVASQIRHRTGIDARDGDRVAVISGGCRTGFSSALKTWRREIPRKDRQVLAFTPYWFGFPMAATFAGFDLIEISTSPSDGYLPTPDLVRRALREYPHVRVILLNNHPTPHGSDWGLDRARELAAEVRRHDLMVVEDMLNVFISARDGQAYSTLLGACPDLLESTKYVGLASLTKGWRASNVDNLGFLIGGESELPGLVRASRTLLWDDGPPKRQAAARWCFTPEGLKSPARVVETARANLASVQRWCCRNTGMALAAVPDGGTTALLDISELVGRRSPSTIVSDERSIKEDLEDLCGVSLMRGSQFKTSFPALRLNLVSLEPEPFGSILNNMTGFLSSFGG